MVKYDKFEVFMIKKINSWAKGINKEDNKAEVYVFTELMWALYEYERGKFDGEIITD